MVLTQNFKDTVQKRVQEDSEFQISLLIEVINCLLEGDTETGKIILRDYINSTKCRAMHTPPITTKNKT